MANDSNKPLDGSNVARKKWSAAVAELGFAVKDVILKILKLFEAEKENPIKYRAFPVKRLSKALGISQTYLYHLKQEDEKEAVNNVVDYMHQQNKKNHNFHRRKLDDFDEDLVTRTVHDLYMQGKPVTLTKLQIVLREKGVDVSQTTVRKVLQRHGFRYRRNVTGRRFMVERDEVIAQRHAYLRRIKKLREQGCHIVYLDETWINTHHTVKGGWVEENQASTSTLEPFCKSTGRFVPSGKGSRLIIADAGSSQMGLIPGCSLVFESKTNKSDYHDEMNAECFTEWFRDTLIPKLDRSSVIVMDNASYHSQLDPQSKAPSSSSRKAEVQAWLDRRGVHYDHEMCKAELLGLVKINKPNPRYIIDELASLHGHEVLRLPPRHCELNPIELVWADVKGYVARNNSAFKKDTIITLYSQARQRIDRVQWQKVESHVIREVEEKFWEVDGIKENEVDPVIIELNYSDNDDTDSEDSFDSGDEKLTDDDDLSDAINDDSNDHDIPCNICQQKEPPGLSARIRNVSWHECELCEKWVHDKCCKESKNKSLCDRCWAIIHNRSFET